MRSETVSYYGEWLPEPVATDRADSRVISKDILSWSLMVLLEKLSARERAVFILKEAYGYEHTQIASVLGISSDLSRQLLTRGRKHLKAAKLTDPVQHQHEAGDALPKFMQAIYNSDMKKLEELLHEDIMISVDGGGKVKASKNNIYGRKHAAVLLFGLYHKFWFVYRIEIAEINHSPAILYFENDSLAACEICEYEEGGTLSRVDIVRNPDKLSSLEKNFQLLSQ